MLHDLGIKYHTDKAYLHNFCNDYEKLLLKDVKTLWEIGILDGASLRMWSEYYPNAKIIGYDIEDKSSLSFNDNVSVKLLDQSNKSQLSELAKQTDIDIIVDDGSHITQHQILTFEMLFNCLKSGGQYVLEDLHTSTNVHNANDYRFYNNKGALQYLLDIISNNVPVNYPGQTNTQQIIDSIDKIQIIGNLTTDNKRSITAIITKN